jgi:hypothetical protein
VLGSQLDEPHSPDPPVRCSLGTYNKATSIGNKL